MGKRGTTIKAVEGGPRHNPLDTRPPNDERRARKLNDRRKARLAALTAALSASGAVAQAAPLAPCFIDPGAFILVPGGCISGYGGTIIPDPNEGTGPGAYHTDHPSPFGPVPSDPTPKVRPKSTSIFVPSSTQATTESDLNTPAVQRMWAEEQAMEAGLTPDEFDLYWALNQPGVSTNFNDSSDDSLSDSSDYDSSVTVDNTTDWPSAPSEPDYTAPDTIATNTNYNSGDDNSPTTEDVGDPINSATGNVHRVQRDFIGLGPFPIRFVRFYNSIVASASAATTELGAGWRGSYDSSVTLQAAQGVPTAIVQRPDGQALVFTNPSGSQWVAADPTVRAVLTSQTDGSGNLTGWTYVTSDDYTESYNASGQLQSIANLAGLTQVLSYGATGQLASVTDPFGHQMTFSYNAQGQLVQATNPAGGVYQYAYDGNDNLTSVTYPDQTTRSYLYENSAFTNALTGVVDENGSRYVTITYEAAGHAVGSVLAGNVQPVSITYNSDGSRTVTDARGTVRQHTFVTTASGAVKPSTKSVTACTIGNCPLISTSVTYNSSGFPASGVDPNGTTTQLTYNARGLLASRTEAAGTPLQRTVNISWHPVFHLPTQVTFPDRVLTYSYDAFGNRTSKTITAGGTSRTWSYAYNSQGLLTQMTSPRTDVSQVWNFAYDNQGHMVSITDPLGHVTRFNSYDAYGHVLSLTDPNGLTATFTYDARGRFISGTRGSRTLSLQRDAVGQVTRITYPNGSSATLTYDAAHRLTDKTDTLGSREHRTLTAAGDVPQLQLFDTGNNIIHQASFSTDGLGRVVLSTDANGQAQSVSYDNNGNPVSATDALGRTSSVTFDVLNRPTSATDALGNTTSVQFNLYNEPLQVTAANGAVTQYSYDSFGELLQETSPDRGVTTMTYSATGVPATHTDARGVVATFGFDSLNRLTNVSYNAPSGSSSPAWITLLGAGILSDNVTFTYDQGPGCTNGVGRLCSRQDQSGIESYAYDSFGDITQQKHTILGFTYGTSYTYDAAGRLTREVYPDGRVVSDARDALERLTNVQSTVNGQASPILTNVQYRADGSPASLTFGNGLTDTRSYDPVGRLVSQIVGLADSRAYTYDAIGNMVGKQTSQEVDQFGYDALDRLTNEQNTLGGSTIQTAFTYDPNGNRLSSAQNGVVTSLTYANSSNRLEQIGSAAVTLDAAGDTVADNAGTRQFYYSAAGRLQWIAQYGIPISAYLYNGAGQRTAKLTLQGISLYHYDIWGRLISETTVGSQPSRDYVWASGIPVAQINHWVPIGNMLTLAHCLPGADGKIDWVTYLHTDGLGTPRVGTDVLQNAVWRWDGEAFGDSAPNQQVPVGAYPVHVNLRNPGQYYDQESGLFYNRFRYYNPQTGRYISSDPVGLFGGLNTYGYGLNQPLTAADPSGQSPIGIVIGALFGGAVNVLENAGSIGGPNQPSILSTFIAGEVGGVVGGALDSPAVASAITGGINQFLEATADGASVLQAAEAAALGAAEGYVEGKFAEGLVEGPVGEATDELTGLVYGEAGTKIAETLVESAGLGPSVGESGTGAESGSSSGTASAGDGPSSP
jgi:RHS repeat-associated protein